MATVTVSSTYEPPKAAHPGARAEGARAGTCQQRRGVGPEGPEGEAVSRAVPSRFLILTARDLWERAATRPQRAVGERRRGRGAINSSHPRAPVGARATVLPKGKTWAYGRARSTLEASQTISSQPSRRRSGASHGFAERRNLGVRSRTPTHPRQTRSEFWMSHPKLAACLTPRVRHAASLTGRPKVGRSEPAEAVSRGARAFQPTEGEAPKAPNASPVARPRPRSRPP